MDNEFAGTGYTVEQLTDMRDDEREHILAQSIFALRQQKSTIDGKISRCQSWLLETMRARKATVAKFAGSKFKVNVETKREWRYQIEGGLDALQNYIDPDEYDKLVKQEWRIDRSMLRQLRARGGRITEIIDASETLARETQAAEVSMK